MKSRGKTCPIQDEHERTKFRGHHTYLLLTSCSDLACSNINFFSILAQLSIVLPSILYLLSIDYELWKEFVESIEFMGFMELKG